MSLRLAVAAPFQRNGVRALERNEFVVALALEFDWFSPDQAKRLVDIAVSESLLDVDDDTLELTFDPGDVAIPDEFQPDESILQERSTFEKLVEAVVATGDAKQTTVAAINDVQATLAVDVEAAATVYARRQGIDVSEFVDQ